MDITKPFHLRLSASICVRLTPIGAIRLMCNSVVSTAMLAYIALRIDLENMDMPPNPQLQVAKSLILPCVGG